MVDDNKMIKFIKKYFTNKKRKAIEKAVKADPYC